MPRKLTDREKLDADLARLAGIRRGPGHPWSKQDVVRVQRLARAVVAREIERALKGVGCFCAPDRPEIESDPYCLRHFILDRLGADLVVDRLTVETLTLDLEGGAG